MPDDHVIRPGNTLESRYDRVMDYLCTKYHSHAPSPPDVHVDERMISEMGYYARMAQDMADQNQFAQDVPLGKLVI
jgi:hypothetical protein